MPKNIRIKAQVGVDKEVKINLDQDFDRLEILSLSINQSDVYNRDCSDFGVIAGRVIANGGFGVPNAKIGVFIPLDSEDEENEVIKNLYPYKKIQSRNELGYRYNLLPSEPDYDGHVNTGSFPKENELLLNQEVSYVYNKYYKFTVKTNDSGDFLIYGVPVGNHQILMETDMSSIGCFSLSPQDIIITGKANEGEFDGAKFKESASIDELPQIVTQTKTIDVFPFWGEESICKAAINRLDFDLRDSGVDIQPTSVFMGSIGTDDGKNSLNRNCVPRRLQGDKCSLVSGPGSVEAIRQTIFTKVSNGQTVPVLERFDFPAIIDDDGKYVINVPMNMNYTITNEFGEEEISNDPTVGIPTTGKYRFRFKFLTDGSGARLRKRGEYLVPNIKEYTSIAADAGANVAAGTISPEEASYSFSVDIDDYPSLTDVIATNDYFYSMRYSQVYTTSLFLKKWVKPVGGLAGFFLSGKWRHIGIKRIKPSAEKDCAGLVTDVPSNNAIKENTFSYILSNIFNTFITIIILVIFAYLIYIALGFMIQAIGFIPASFQNAWTILMCALPAAVFGAVNAILTGPRITLPMKNYDDCEDCQCNSNLFTFVLNLPFGALGSGSGTASTAGADADASCQTLPPFNNFPSDQPQSIDNQNSAGTQGWNNGGGGAGWGCLTVGLGGTFAQGLLNTAIISFGTLVGFAIAASVVCLLANFPSLGGILQAACNIAQQAYGAAAAIVAGVAYGVVALYITNLIAALILNGNSVWRGLMEWRTRRTVFDFLCEGGISETYNNDWINGFLYHFQFKMKVVNDVASYCERTLYYSPVQGKFYYRASPWAPSLPYPEGTFSNILYSTTLTELGVPSKQLKEACASAAGAEKCSMMPQLGSTSRQNTSDLVSYVGTARLLFEMINNTPFWVTGPTSCFFNNTTDLVLDGDIAQAFSQNNQFGIAEFVTPQEFEQAINNPAGTTAQIAAENNPFYWNLLIVGSGLNDNEGTNNNGITDIEFKVEEQTLRDCLLGGDTGICTGINWTQIVPYYPWDNGPTPFGDRNNYWDTNTIITINHQPSPYFDVTSLSPISNNTAPSNPTYGPFGTPPWVTSFDMRLATHFHFYFGLRNGSTSYNEFSKRYIDTEEEYV